MPVVAYTTGHPQVVSIGIFWFYLVPFLYSGVYFLQFINIRYFLLQLDLAYMFPVMGFSNPTREVYLHSFVQVGSLRTERERERVRERERKRERE